MAQYKQYDLVGQIRGRLTVISSQRTNKGIYWLCQCECGNQKLIARSSLTRKNKGTHSCGCLSSELKKTRTKHGGYGTTEYRSWVGLKNRCTNPKNKAYNDYGGRGITVCDEWLNSFPQFLADMGPRPSSRYSIDRIENDKGYSKENCRWATRITQSNNKRSNKFVTYKGKTLSATKWAKRVKKDPSLIRERLRYGWSVEDALFRPIDTRCRTKAYAQNKY